MLTSEFPPKGAGIGNYVRILSQKLVERGHAISVLTRGTPAGLRIEDLGGIKVYRERFIPIYPLHVRLDGVFLDRLFKSIRDRFDILHTHAPLLPVLKSNLPNLLTFHTCYRQEARSSRGISRR